MSLGRYYARAGADPVLIQAVATELRARWDPAGEFAAPDEERDPDAHARAILGMLATGADIAAVMGYLRRAEEAVLGVPRSTAHERHALAERIWRRMVDRAVEVARTEGADVRATE